jgi:hypothetical protein
MPDDVGTGAVRYLTGFPDVTGKLGAFPGNDPITANAGRPWLFSDTTTSGVLTRMKGTQQAALVLADFGGWEVAPPLGSIRFRRLRVDLWVDPLRDAENNVTETSALTTNRGLSVFAAVQFRLQRKDGDTQAWGDLVTCGCQLLTDVAFTAVPDGDWLQRGTAWYGVSCTGWTDAAE